MLKLKKKKTYIEKRQFLVEWLFPFYFFWDDLVIKMYRIFSIFFFFDQLYLKKYYDEKYRMSEKYITDASLKK